jgi:hypothetical protein
LKLGKRQSTAPNAKHNDMYVATRLRSKMKNLLREDAALTPGHDAKGNAAWGITISDRKFTMKRGVDKNGKPTDTI